MKTRARNLRKNNTEAENRMWFYLRDRRLNGYKFMREYVIEYYIVDFLCREKKLIVELDGSQHMDAVSYDDKRTKYLEKKGYRVLRVWNHEVFINIHGVMEMILFELGCFPSPPAPLPAFHAGRGEPNAKPPLPN